MSVPTETASKAKTKRRVRRTALAAAGVVGVAVVAGVAALYVQRGPIGARLAIDYLEKKGVPATIRFERLGPDGFTGSAVLGPPGDPDLIIERMEVEFEPFPLVRDGLSPRVRFIRLVRPQLKADYKDGKVQFGSLQPLIDEFLSRPVTGPPPSVVIEQGSARVSTPAGLIRVGGSANLPKGRVAHLDAAMGPHVLAAGGRQVRLQQASIQLRGSGQRLSGRLALQAPLLWQDGVRAEGAVLAAAVDLPYGTGANPFDGRFAFDGILNTSALVAGDARIRDARLQLALGGTSRGPLERLRLDGRSSVQLQAASLSGAVQGTTLKLTAQSRAFSLTRTSDRAALSMPLGFAGSAAMLGAGETRLRQASIQGASARFDAQMGRDGVRIETDPSAAFTAAGLQAGGTAATGLQLNLRSEGLMLATGPAGARLTGPLETRGGIGRVAAGDLALVDVRLDGQGRATEAGLSWRGSMTSRSGTSAVAARRLAAAASAAGPERAALARAVQTLRLEAPDLRLEAVAGRTEVSLGAPIRLTGEGADIVLRQRGAAPLLVAAGGSVSGGLAVTTSGAALPKLQLDVADYRLAGGGMSGQANFQLADFNAGPLRGLDLEGAGRLTSTPGGFGLTATRCAAVSVDAVQGEEGALVTDASARVCPQPSRPLVRLGSSGWQVQARIEEAGARLPAAEIEIEDVAGSLSLSGGEEGLGAGTLEIAQAGIADRAAERRFLPVTTAGTATLKAQSWVGAFTVADGAKGRALARIGLSHDMKTGQGGAEIDASGMTFAKDGLQPADISPLAAGFVTDAVGPASFVGRIGWSGQGLTSAGRIATTGLDFRSTFGALRGLKADVQLTSLAPLATEAAQTVSVSEIDWLVPLRDASLTLTLTPAEAKIVRARVEVGKGEVVLDPLDLKLGAILPTSGTLRLSDVDLDNLLAEFDLSDKISIAAKVDGVLPFAFTAEGLRFTDGRIFADGPGRISIKREALTGVAGADGAATPPNAMQSFAYQALENLAFTQMDAQIASRPMGRLGVLFHINGRHDPAVALRPRIGILDLIQGRAFEKDLPLPKGTPVNLTLDTSLNFDELLAAYSQAGRSTPVQP